MATVASFSGGIVATKYIADVARAPHVLRLHMGLLEAAGAATELAKAKTVSSSSTQMTVSTLEGMCLEYFREPGIMLQILRTAGFISTGDDGSKPDDVGRAPFVSRNVDGGHVPGNQMDHEFIAKKEEMDDDDDDDGTPAPQHQKCSCISGNCFSRTCCSRAKRHSRHRDAQVRGEVMSVTSRAREPLHLVGGGPRECGRPASCSYTDKEGATHFLCDRCACPACHGPLHAGKRFCKRSKCSATAWLKSLCGDDDDMCFKYWARRGPAEIPREWPKGLQFTAKFGHILPAMLPLDVVVWMDFADELVCECGGKGADLQAVHYSWLFLAHCIKWPPAVAFLAQCRRDAMSSSELTQKKMEEDDQANLMATCFIRAVCWCNGKPFTNMHDGMSWGRVGNMSGIVALAREMGLITEVTPSATKKMAVRKRKKVCDPEDSDADVGGANVCDFSSCGGCIIKLGKSQIARKLNTIPQDWANTDIVKVFRMWTALFQESLPKMADAMGGDDVEQVAELLMHCAFMSRSVQVGSAGPLNGGGKPVQHTATSQKQGHVVRLMGNGHEQATSPSTRRHDDRHDREAAKCPGEAHVGTKGPQSVEKKEDEEEVGDGEDDEENGGDQGTSCGVVASNNNSKGYFIKHFARQFLLFMEARHAAFPYRLFEWENCHTLNLAKVHQWCPDMTGQAKMIDGMSAAEAFDRFAMSPLQISCWSCFGKDAVGNACLRVSHRDMLSVAEQWEAKLGKAISSRNADAIANLGFSPTPRDICELARSSSLIRKSAYFGTPVPRSEQGSLRTKSQSD